MNSQKYLRPDRASNASDSDVLTTHQERTAVEGLEDLFKWASEMVATGEDPRARNVRENRIRRRVLAVLQELREQKAVQQAKDEIAYLQRRVIALLQKLNEITEENAAVKEMMLAQCYALQRIPELEKEIEHLKARELESKSFEQERENLMNALAKLTIERDFLDELLHASEEENSRLARLLADTRAEVDKLSARRWWHWLWPQQA